METKAASLRLVERYPPGAILSEEDFVARRDEDVWAEYVDGEVVMAAAASIKHEDIFFLFISTLRAFVESHKLGQVLGSQVEVRLRPGLRRTPDIVFVAQSRLEIIGENHIEGAPDLIVEIVSPDSVARDWREKYLEYEQAGVREYWVADPQQQVLEVYTLGAEGRYALLEPQEDAHHSQVVPGFWLRAGWLWQSPLPGVLDVARELGLI
jgi:Uma2 family endonuclease